MKKITVLFLFFFLASQASVAQVESLPVTHPLYSFLKRMSVKGLIDRYDDVVLPYTRKEAVKYLQEVKNRDTLLTSAERGQLADYMSEFQFDRTGTRETFHALIDGDDSLGLVAGEFSQREKFLYDYADSSVSFFVNGIVTVDTRRFHGDDLGTAKSTYVQFGARVRGTIWGKLGFAGTSTNAGFWGSRQLLERDPEINQSHEIRVGDTQNFDYTEGYVRYDANIVSLQLGRERILWGAGYDQKLVLSNNARPFDFVRLDARYKAIHYTFMHAWLLGSPSSLTFTLPSDTSAKFNEPVIADKYLAAHRIQFSFPGVFDVGFQEMYIYSNRSVDLAYLNPLVLMESVQRSRGERDNGFWTFDVTTHFVKDLELRATMLYDDINLPYLFSKAWVDRYAWQAGMMYADPFSMDNTAIMVEYVRIEPYVFSHGRSRDDSYTSYGQILGTTIGPNSDAWSFIGEYQPARNLTLSARVTFERTGKNVVAADGTLMKNVGGNVLQPHRDSDPWEKQFLDGVRVNTRRLTLAATWEIVNQIWCDVRYEFDSTEALVAGSRDENNLVILRVRTEF